MLRSNVLKTLSWETRNLGVSAFALSDEFFVEPDFDLLTQCLSELQASHRSIFVQARLPTNSRISRIIESANFYFIETTLSPYSNLRKNVALSTFSANPGLFLPARYSLNDMHLTADVQQYPILLAAIKGIAVEAFSDDRFHRDHNCDPTTASRRYLFWVEDLLNDTAVRFHVLSHKERPVSFMASREGNLLLAGFAAKFAGSGMGEYFWLSVMQSLMSQQIDRVETLISANNTRVLNLYAKIGFKFRFPQSTFHYWSKASVNP